jgi:hypothetical protein
MTYENPVFVDWLSIHQAHSQPQPVVVGGEVVTYDANGVETFARSRPTRFRGSFETSVGVHSNGVHVSLSGNTGRFDRQDNLFGPDLDTSVAIGNRILAGYGLAPMGPGQRLADPQAWSGAWLSRLDLTCNFATGSMGSARAFIRWLQSRSVSRMKKGGAGDDSVWFVNTRHMLKAYLKGPEMLAHGADPKSPVVEYAHDQGIVRVELEFKRRLLQTEGIRHLGDCTMGKLIQLFDRETELMRRQDRSSDEDILDHVPLRHRAIAAAWLAGKDAKDLCSLRTFYRHKKALAECGLDISEPRPAIQHRAQVRVIELQPLVAPDWYRRAA